MFRRWLNFSENEPNLILLRLSAGARLAPPLAPPSPWRCSVTALIHKHRRPGGGLRRGGGVVSAERAFFLSGVSIIGCLHPNDE